MITTTGKRDGTMRRGRCAFWAGMVLAGLGATGCQSGTHEGARTANARESSSVTLDPANMTRVGTVDEIRLRVWALLTAATALVLRAFARPKP